MRGHLFLLVGLLVIFVFALSPSTSSRAAIVGSPTSAGNLAATVDPEQVVDALQSTPLMFVENVGQFAEGARFQLRGAQGDIWLADDAIWVTLLEPANTREHVRDRFDRVGHVGETDGEESEAPIRQGVNIRFSFVGANPAPDLEPYARLETTISYFLGNDPEGWRADVPVWAGVRYVDLYPGLDLELSGSDAMQPRLVCRLADCGAALQTVELRVEGVEEVVLETDGLHVATSIGGFRMPLFEVVDGAGQPIVLEGFAPQTIGARLRQPYVMGSAPAAALPGAASPADDPDDLLYSTFLGGSEEDAGWALTLDSTGSAVVSGWTYSTDFPTTAGPFDASYGGNALINDAFVAKLSADGSSLLYSTFLGGSEGDEAWALALDSAGNAVVSGWTDSTDFPITAGVFDANNHSGGAFITKLSADGSSLLYSTFLGGSDWDEVSALKLDSAGNAVVSGMTASIDFPTTVGAIDTSFNGHTDVFVAKLSADGSDLLYSTFLGGSDWDQAYTIALDGAGNALVSGVTFSIGFPTTAGAFDTIFDGFNNAFVAKLSVDGRSLLYSTFLGDSGAEASALALDSAGNAVVSGMTDSADFPTTGDVFDNSFNGFNDAFVVKLSADGSSLLYSTFLGGSGWDEVLALMLDSAGNVVVSGVTNSTDFPTTAGAFDTSLGVHDGFVARLSADGSSLLYSSFLGGSDWNEGATALTLDSAGNAVVSGQTFSTDFPTTAGAFDSSFNGNGDVYLTKLAVGGETSGELDQDILNLIASSSNQIQLVSVNSQDVAMAGDYFLDKVEAGRVGLVVNTVMDLWGLRGVDWSLMKTGFSHITTPGYKAAVHASWNGWSTGSAAARHWYKPIYDRFHNDRELVFNQVSQSLLRYYSQEAIEGPVKDWLIDRLVPGAGTPVTDHFGNPSIELAASYQSELLNEQALILLTLPGLSLTDEEEAAYRADIAARRQVHNQMVGQLNSHRNLIWESYQDSLEDDGNWRNYWGPVLVKWVVVGACTLAWDGPGYYISSTGFAIYNAVSGTRELLHTEKMLDQSLRFLTGRTSLTYQQIALNTVAALNIIRAGDSPQIAKGTLGTTVQASIGQYRIWPRLWWAEEASQVEIPITNNGSYDTTYSTLAAYTNSSFWVGPQSFLPEGETTELEPGAQATAIIDFKGWQEGLSPDEGSLVDLLVVGATETGLYPVSEISVVWEPQRVERFTRLPSRTPPGFTEAQADSAPVYGFPLSSAAVNAYGTTNQQLIVNATNPFTLTVSATLTQTVPAQFTLIDSGGASVIGSNLVWTQVLTPGMSLEVRPVLHWPGNPGSNITLPGAELTFQDPDTGEGDTYVAPDETIEAPWPLQVAVELPSTLRSGEVSEVPVTIDSITDTTVAGSLVATVTTAEGQVLWTTTLPVNVAAQSTQTLAMPVMIKTDEMYVVISGSVNLAAAEHRVFFEIIPVQRGGVYLPVIRGGG